MKPDLKSSSSAFSSYSFQPKAPEDGRTPRRWLSAFALAILTVVLIAGCRTGEPTSASFASVVIPGKTPEQISQAAGAVFQADGYSIGSLNPGSMMFQKEASRGASLAYGGVVDTYYGSTTVVRVRAQVVDLGSGSYRLQCKAYMVRRAEDAFFEDESPLLNIRSGPYQKLLDEVAKRLK